MCNRSRRTLVLLMLGLIAARTAAADGRILIKTPAQAQAAQAAGKLNPVSPSNSQSITMQNLFSGPPINPTPLPIGTTTLSTTAPPVPPPGSFISSTASPSPGSTAPFSGGSYYAYGVDPDATHYHINIQFEIPQLFSSTQPSGIKDIGIELGDTANKTRLWRWNTSALQTGPQTFDFSFSNGLGAAGSTSYLDNGINLKNVQLVQFSYDGVLTPTYPHDPTGNQGLWVQIDHVIVTPEPDSFLSLMLGMLGLAGWAAYKQRKRSGTKMPV